MKTTLRSMLPVLGIALVAGVVGCSTQKAAKPTLEGRWSGFEAGRSERTTIEFAGNQFTYWDAVTNELGGGTFVANEAVQPMQMDLTFERIGDPDYVGTVGLAIYELRDDELAIAGAEPGTTTRPTRFEGEAGVRVFHFKRQ